MGRVDSIGHIGRNDLPSVFNANRFIQFNRGRECRCDRLFYHKLGNGFALTVNPLHATLQYGGDGWILNAIATVHVGIDIEFQGEQATIQDV